MDETTTLTDTADLIIAGDTGSLIDALSPEEREAIVTETKPAESKDPNAGKITLVDGVEMVMCNACKVLHPITDFYRVTKGGKVRQPCRDAYDLRYYGRKHGERKAKATSVFEATNAHEQRAHAVAPVVETFPTEENAPTGQGEPAETAPVATTETKKSSSKRKAKVAPVEQQDEAVINVPAE